MAASAAKIETGQGIISESSRREIMASVELFKTSIIQIRDKLRGPGAHIAGMESFRHICLYILSRYMTRAEVSRLGVPAEFAWEHLIEIARTKNGGLQTAFDSFFSKDADCLINHFDRLFGTNEFIFSVKDMQVHMEILEIMDRINMADVDTELDALGWAYEQHLSTGSSSAGRDLGQYFTDRSICSYMTEMCRPKVVDGVPESVCDPTMGTGGFLTTYVKYLSREKVDWTQHQGRIHGFDTDSRVAGVSRLNLFMTMNGVRATGLITKDSLYGGIGSEGYDIILANMPFGVKGIKHGKCCKPVRDLKIEGAASEPLFLQLMMTALNRGGRCAVVVPDGVLVNGTKCHIGTRKHLLDRFELRRVVKMQGKFFMNTSIKPSILFFENTGRATEAVEFWEANRGDNGEITEQCVARVPVAELDKAVSLDMRRYVVEEVAASPGVGFPVVRLKDICKVSFGERITQKNDKGSSYSVYGSGCETFKTDNYNREGKTCKIGRFAISESNMAMIVNGPYWLLDSGFTVESSDPNRMKTEFLWYCLLLDKKNLATLSTGSCQKNIKMDMFFNVKYPCPPISVQEEIITTLDRIYEPGTTELAETIKMTDRAMDLILADPSGSTLEPIIEAQRLIRKSSQMVADVRSQMVADVWSQMVDIMGSVKIRGFPMVRLEDVCDLFSGKANRDVNCGNIPFFASSGMVGTRDKFNFEGKFVITARTQSIGSVSFYDGKFWASDNTIVLKTKNETIIIRYLYFWLYLNKKIILSISNKNVIPLIKKSDVAEIKMPLPPVAFQEEVVARLDLLQSQITSLESLQKQSEDNARFILDSYLHSGQHI